MDSNDLIVKQVLPKFILSLVVSFLGMVIGMMFIPPMIAILCSVGVLIAIIVMAFKNKGSSTFGFRMKMRTVYILTFLLGTGIYPSISVYLSSIGAMWVLGCFIVTIAIFGALSLYTYYSKKDFSFLGGILIVALLGLIGVMIVNIFIASSIISLLLGFGGVVIFGGFVVYDLNQMKNKNFNEKDVPVAVFNLYLDFINLFLSILRIAGFFLDD